MPRKKEHDEPDHITLADPDPPASAPQGGLAVPVGLTFVRESGTRSFLGVVTIALSDLPRITVGATRSGPNGLGLISYQDRLFSWIGDYVPDDPAREPLRGLPVYAEV